MKGLILTTCLVATTSAFYIAPSVEPDDQALLSHETSPERYLIELSPEETRWVTEDEKWALRREGLNFMDITDHPHLGASRISTNKAKEVTFPHKPVYQDTIVPLISNLSKSHMRSNLETFTSFHTRYYKSEYGVQSAEWLYSKISSIISSSPASKHKITVKKFPHKWGQPSLIATIPGKSNKTVVIGAHQDSINLFLPSILSAPGADDDGSGTVTILEALRVILQSSNITSGEMPNTLEFHWYSAEEGGLLGSQAVFSSYEAQGRDVKAMLQQDMTGFVKRTVDAGEEESVGVITDYVDKGLTEFIKKIVTEYCTIPFILTKCGYACSDHASASKAGYPSAFVIESDFRYSDNHIHTSDDRIEYLSFDHMLQHARLTLALAYELAFAEF
ncbi:MAG: Leucine aminopeptidase 1 [Caeruleum heppii]|nr:MAG: Leucine aminopeptidase 1 [Caeruleum heppii]